METINIINNFDQKIFMENILISNQKKLLDMIINIFEFGYLSDKIINEEIVSEYLNKQNFINWELFLNLINLNSSFYFNRNKNYKANSLYYIVESKAYNLINFLLELTLKYTNDNNDNKKKLINWYSFFDKSNKYKPINLFYLIIKNVGNSDLIVDNIINLSLSNNNYKKLIEEKDLNSKNAIYYIISRCSLSNINKLLDNNLIEFDWEDDYLNSLVHWACKRNFNNFIEKAIEKKIEFNLTNKGGRTPLHLACIKNNILIVKLLIKEDNINLESIDSQLNSPIDYAVKYGSSEMVKLLLDQGINLGLNEEKMFYNIIQYHNKDLVEYLINFDIFNVDKTNLIWSLLMFYNKSLYSQMITYSGKKIFKILLYSNNYYESKYISDLFTDE